MSRFATPTRTRRAALLGLGFDQQDDHRRILTGAHCLALGGSPETHARLSETMIRLESELERRGLGLGEIEPLELAEIAWRIDSLELFDLALRINDGLEQSGMAFKDATPEELTRFSGGMDWIA